MTRSTLLALTLGLAACGGTPSVLVVVVDDGGGSAAGVPGTELDAGGGDGDGGPDGAPDAPPVVDAGIDASTEIACGSASGPVSDHCEILTPCDATTCAGGYRYKCTSGPGFSGRPPIDRCVELPPDGVGASFWCCPPGCVRNAFNDQSACSGQRFMFCAPGATPPSSCAKVGDAFCCN